PKSRRFRARRRPRPPRPAPAPIRPTRRQHPHTHGLTMRDCRTTFRNSEPRPCAPRPGARPAWSRHDPSTPACARCSFARALRGLAAPALHGTQDSAQDVEFIAVELRAVEQAPQPLHQMAGPILEIDFIEDLIK